MESFNKDIVIADDRQLGLIRSYCVTTQITTSCTVQTFTATEAGGNTKRKGVSST